MPEKSELGLSFAEMIDIGGRPSNQDALASAIENNLACFVVSDGVGGHVGGEIASKLITETIVHQFRQELIFSPRALQSYVAVAAMELEERKKSEARLKEMSATVAVILIDAANASALWAHLGDTRVYHFRSDKILSVTKDHSLVQQLVDAGYCTPNQLNTHPQRSVLYAALGMDSEMSESKEVSMGMSAIEVDDSFLICSDGFWEWLSEKDLESTLQTTDTMHNWLNKMRDIVLKNAKQSRSQDNYTALAIRCIEKLVP